MPGKDVLFNIKVAADGSNAAVLKSFADQHAKTQQSITQTAAKETERQQAEKMKAHTRVEDHYKSIKTKSFQLEQNLNLKSIQDAKRQTEELAAWKTRVHRNSIQQEYDDNLRLIKRMAADRIEAAKHVANEQKRLNRELEKNLANESRQATINSRNQARAGKRFEKATDRVIGGVGELTRGVAYTGLIGEGNTQHILNTVAAVEGGASLYRGGRRLAGGIGTMMSGGAVPGAGGVVALSGAAATTAAALAALTGVVAAVASGFLTYGQAKKHGFGGGADHGSPTDTVASGGVSAGYFLYRHLVPRGMRGDKIGAFSGLNYAFGDLSASQDTIDAAKKNNPAIMAQIERRRAFGLETADNLTAYSQHRLESLRGMGDTSAKLAGLRGIVGDVGGKTMGAKNDDVRAAGLQQLMGMEQAMLELQKQAHSETVAAANARLAGARGELDAIKQSFALTKEQYELSKRGLGGDLARYANASPEERATLREIKRKQKGGLELTKEETAVASQYNTFGDLAQSNAERQAMRAGAGDIFDTAIADRDRLGREVAEKGKEVAKAELDVKNNLQLLVRVEGASHQEITDAVSKKVFDFVHQQNKELEAGMSDKIDQKMKAFANR